MSRPVYLFTDASCHTQSGSCVGAYMFNHVVGRGKVVKHAVCLDHVTNPTVAEMETTYVGLYEVFQRVNLKKCSRVVCFTDSASTIHYMKSGSGEKKSDIAVQLRQISGKIRELIELSGVTVEFVKVKAHVPVKKRSAPEQLLHECNNHAYNNNKPHRREKLRRLLGNGSV